MPNDQPQKKHCFACGESKEFSEYFGNHWLKNNVYGRCKECVRGGLFQVTNPVHPFDGQPKPPRQVLYERGWLNPDTPEVYTPAKIGEIVMDQTDADLLLDNFDIAGFYGYGGLDEGLCGMPGCIESNNLKQCSGCRKALYCCADHQKKHWKLHKPECRKLQSLSNHEKASILQVFECPICHSKAEPRYGKCPQEGVPDAVRGRRMCGKCASHLGIALTDWAYPHPAIAEAYPKKNPFGGV